MTFKPFEGRAVVAHVLRTVFEVFEDFRYTDQLCATGPTSSLVFRRGSATARSRASTSCARTPTA